MKKTLLICTFIATSLTFIGCEDNTQTSQAQQTPVEIQTTTPIQEAPITDNLELITEELAKETALNHADLSEADITNLRIKLDYDDGVPEYDVEFYVGNKEYDYEINAITGAVISFDFEIEDDFNNTTQSGETAETITEDEAKTIALKHANLSEDDVTNMYIKLDYDDGRAEYDVEFYNGNKEYDYEIDAITGNINSYDFEIENNVNTSNTSSNNSTSNSSSTSNNTTTPSTTTGTITQDEAKAIALKHANLTETQVTNLRIKLDYDDGRAEYDVEFYVGNKEYDYEIDATTGNINSYDFDIEDDFNTSNNATAPSTTGTITQDEAKAIALKHANLTETQVTNLRIKLDYDDGRAEYDVEFYVGNKEYDYEIDATTGNINSYDFDIDDDFNTSNNATASTGTITQDEAKAIALNHAGVSASSISNFKIELDYDDGRAEYEIEWDIGRTEYEYEINASTGAIISYDIDND